MTADSCNTRPAPATSQVRVIPATDQLPVLNVRTEIVIETNYEEGRISQLEYYPDVYVRNAGSLIASFGLFGVGYYLTIEDYLDGNGLVLEDHDIFEIWTWSGPRAAIANDPSHLWFSPAVPRGMLHEDFRFDRVILAGYGDDVTIDALHGDNRMNTLLERSTTMRNLPEYYQITGHWNFLNNCFVAPLGEAIVMYNYSHDWWLTMAPNSVRHYVMSIELSSIGHGANIVPLMLTSDGNRLFSVVSTADGELMLIGMRFNDDELLIEPIGVIPDFELGQEYSTIAVQGNRLLIRLDYRAVIIELPAEVKSD